MSDTVYLPYIGKVLRYNYRHILPATFENIIDDEKLANLNKGEFKELTVKIQSCSSLSSKLHNRRLKVNRDKARRKHEAKCRQYIYLLTEQKRNLLAEMRDLLLEIQWYEERNSIL